MADTQSASYELKLVVTETKDFGLDLAGNPTITHTAGTDSGTLTASTTPPATKTWSDTRALVAGADTFDLYALAGPLSTIITFNTLKVQMVKIVCPTTNSAAMTFASGDANPYNLFGVAAGTDTVTLKPGDKIELIRYDTGQDCSNVVRNVKVTGTGTDSYHIILVAG